MTQIINVGLYQQGNNVTTIDNNKESYTETNVVRQRTFRPLRASFLSVVMRSVLRHVILADHVSVSVRRSGVV